MTALIFALIALGTAIGALVVACRTSRQVPKSPTREERIARARATIEACRGAELALECHIGELPAALILSSHRTSAAHAKHELRVLGIEVTP